MDKKNCKRIETFLIDLFNQKHISIKIKIIDKYARGNLFYRMEIKIKKDYRHLLSHIYSCAYSMCALGGEYLDKEKIEKGVLYLS